MSILSTDKKLISFGTDYSAGSGIRIIDHTISVTGEFGKTYSAGPNIGIYDVSGRPTISSKDWTQDIDQSSSGAVTESISQFHDWINGQYTEDISNVTNNLTALSGDLSSYYKKTETSSKAEISAALDYVSAHAVGDVEVNNYVHNNSATIDEVNSAYQSNSATYLTAVNIPESATWNETSNVVSSNSASWSEGKTYEGISPIVVNNNESKISADTWTLTAGDGISFVENSANKVTRIDVTAQGGDPEVQNLVRSNSSTWGSVTNKLDTTAFSTVSGTFLTAVNIPESATWDETSDVVKESSASWNQGKTYEGISPIVVNNNENIVSAETWTLSAGDGVSLVDFSADKVTRIDVTAQGGSVSSKYGTITVDGSDIEATNKALEFKSNGFRTSFRDDTVDEGDGTTYTWNDYSEGTTFMARATYYGNNSATLTYSSNTNVTGVITIPSFQTSSVVLQLPNATAIHFTSTDTYGLSNTEVTAASSLQVKELAWKSDLPTYTYNSNNKLSAINGSALVGNEDYLVEQGFVQNLKSPNGTIVVKGNKIEGTNSAIKSDTLIEGFVSAYGEEWVGPGHSATLTWDRYVPNAVLSMSSDGYYEGITLTYSSNTNVTGTITLSGDMDTGTTKGSLELPTDSTSIVIGNENDYNRYNFTVSAKDDYEVGELAWASAIPTYEYDSTNKISAINGSALAGGGDVPEDVMVESAIGYNAVGEISAYGNSAIAQYGAEKQWLVHDDTLVHASNSDQYALGVNLSAIAQLLGVDETVLWENQAGYTEPPITLSESLSSFKTIKFVGRNEGSTSNYIPYKVWEFDTDSLKISNYITLEQIMPNNPGNDWNVGIYCRVSNLDASVDKTLTIAKTDSYTITSAGTWSRQATDSFGNVRLHKVIGIGRKQ